MKISTKITGLTGSIVLFNILGGTLAFFAFRQQQNEARLLVEESMTVCRSIIDINRYHHDHNLLFTQTMSVGEREVIEMEGLEEFNASIDVFRATCGQFDHKIFSSLSSLDSLCDSHDLPPEFLDNFKMLRDQLVALHEKHEVCMPHTQAVFDYIELGNVEAARKSAQVVWDDEAKMEAGIEELIVHQDEFGHRSLAAAKERQNQVLYFLIGVFGISLFLGFFLSWFTAGRIVRSLRHAVTVARKIAEGDRSVRIRKFTNDESGELLESMNSMLQSLNQAESKLLKTNACLEKKVKERTLELAESNVHLRKQVEERKLKEEELVEINSELNHFLYRTSHDLKGPVSSIQGLLNVAQLEVNDPMSLEYFKLVCQATTQLDAILVGLIDIAKIRQDEPECVPVDFQTVIDELYKHSQSVPGFETIALHTEVDCDRIFYSDQYLLSTIIKALLSNSIQYQNPEVSNRFEFRVLEDHESVVIIAADNGLGIDPEIKDHVFELFFRGQNRSGGTGMGLFMVQEAVKKLRGSIHLESTLGQGTTLQIRLPQLAVPVLNQNFQMAV